MAVEFVAVEFALNILEWFFLALLAALAVKTSFCFDRVPGQRYGIWIP